MGMVWGLFSGLALEVAGAVCCEVIFLFNQGNTMKPADTDSNRLATCLAAIKPVDPALVAEGKTYIDSLTKPVGSLGRLEELAARLYAIQGGVRPLAVDPARILTFGGDHGVTEEGINAAPPIITRQQMNNFLNGGGGISVLCRCNGVDHMVVDAGVAGEDFAEHPKLVRRKIASGTANMAKGPAMTRDECLAALVLGIDMAQEAYDKGFRVVGTGEMGIGNTTPSTALFCALFDLDPADVTGPGAGVPPAGIAGKAAVIKKSLAVNAGAIAGKDPVAILAAVGGLEIAAMTGLILGGASLGMAVMTDGFISSASYAVARGMAPAVGGYCFFAHASAEPGHVKVLELLGERALVDLDFRLGEGTGAAIGIAVLRSAAAMFNDMATFNSAGVTAVS